MAYFSNSSEGDVLEIQCAECPYGESACPVYGVQACFNYDQVGNKLATEILNMLIDKKGACQMLSLINKRNPTDRRQMKLFGGGS